MGNVTLDGVGKVYDSAEEQVVAVSDLDLDIEDGEFLVLVGPSGCGKSTTLRMIAGLETITEGTITIGNEVVNEKEPKDRDIAMVFQNYALYPHKTVRENMSFGLKYSSDLSTAEMRERVEETAEMMGIEELLDEKPSQLSGGQRQRVALGRAIVRDPAAFLFDEPLSNLDAKLRTHMRTEITKLQTDLDVTTVYVTHDQAEAMTMGDRIAVLDGGELQQVGTPNEVYNHPANEFVAGFIGSPSMNFMSMSVVRRGGTTALVADHDESLTYRLDDAASDLPVEPGDSVTLGVRPEDLRIVDGAESNGEGRRLDAAVQVVEPMGSDNFLSLDVGLDDAWVARVDPSYTPEERTSIQVTLDYHALNLFDDDGMTIKSRGTEVESFHGRVSPSH
ncbi:ABC transporter ATP-binding protein [Haloplanus natans]|uniref:ABC transporter ATP-binding protein n=1 Tax=Haloplanus natans TaxID=376171 RepID=UPI000677ADC4|nr:sn-glycerol-3-phosphate ABC transporter ATP-binding protein UgpC [Haloplanus natans]